MRPRTTIGFSVIEIMLVVAVLAILVTVTVIGYNGWQQRTSGSSVQSDIRQAVSALESYKNFKNNYPPNLAGTGFASSQGVALKLSTNAPSVGVYQGLSGEQNAQLFLNACNANIFETPNNTACSFEGNTNGAKIHVKGTVGSNAIWNSPINPTDLTLSCGSSQSACDQALNKLITQFYAQGGTFPVTVPLKNVALPEPTLQPNGPASRYCIEGRSASFPSIIYYSLSGTTTVETGPCPNDPTLHYFQ